MPIKQLTPMLEIERYTDEQIARLEYALLYNLAFIGETCLNIARSTDSYKDQTGNLRSSISYIIVENGRIVKSSDFAPSDKGTDKARGQKTGKEYAKTLARKFPREIALIVVAGMGYAAYVSAKGKDVLDSSELHAEKLAKQLLKQLGFN